MFLFCDKVFFIIFDSPPTSIYVYDSKSGKKASFLKINSVLAVSHLRCNWVKIFSGQIEKRQSLWGKQSFGFRSHSVVRITTKEQFNMLMIGER